MKKILITVFLMSIFGAFAQNDTIWVNSYYQKSTKEDAKYFRFLTKNQNGTFHVKEYYKSGQLYFEGTTFSEDVRDFDGEISVYAKDGFLSNKVIYQDKSPKSISSYLPNGEEFLYEYDKTSYNGSGNLAYYTGMKDAVIFLGYQENKNYYQRTYRLDEKKNKILLQEHIYENDIKTKSLSYDFNGKYVGECTYSSYLPYDGIVIEYFLEDVKIKSNQEYKEGVIIAEQSYFTNGRIKKTTKTVGGEESSVFYDATGKQIGKFTRNTSDDYYYETGYNGTIVEYDYLEGKEDNITTIREYDNGKLIKEVIYDLDDNSKYTITTYKNEYVILKKENYINGKLVDSLIYDEDGKIFEGTEIISKNEKITYKNGKIVSAFKTYSDGKKFAERKENTETFFDKNGKILGKVIYKDLYNNGYDSPFDGQFYRLYGDLITEHSVYKDGKTTQSTYWDYSYVEPIYLIKKTVYGYINPYGSSDISEETKYYKNGKVASEIFYEGYYKKTKGNFYEENGKLLAQMDYVNNEGTEYLFFEDGNVEKITTYKKGEITHEKQYKKEYSKTDYYSFEYKLVREVDYNKEGVFYLDDKVFKAEYKDGKSYNGNVLDISYSDYTLIPYKNGVIQGDKVKYDFYSGNIIRKENYENGRRIGKVTEYDYDGNLLSEKNYDEYERLQGVSKTYEKDGSLLEDLIYQDGKIVSGFQYNTSYSYYYDLPKEKTVYKDGKVIQKTGIKDKKIIFTETLIEGSKYDVIYFYENGNKLITFQKDNELINGTLRYFSDKGKELYKAQLENGKFVSGELLLKGYYGAIPQYDYIKLTKAKKDLKAIGYDKSGKQVFETTETVKKDFQGSLLLKGLNATTIYTDLLYGIDKASGNYDYDGYNPVDVIDVPPPKIEKIKSE